MGSFHYKISSKSYNYAGHTFVLHVESSYSCDDMDLPIYTQALCQHSPVITSSIRRIQAQTQLFPKRTL